MDKKKEGKNRFHQYDVFVTAGFKAKICPGMCGE